MMTTKDQHGDVEKRGQRENASISTDVSKKRKFYDDHFESTEKTMQQKVNSSELASAFALASLAGLAMGGMSSTNTPAKEAENKQRSGEKVQNASSWEETRSPKADQASISPDQRLPESPRTPSSTLEGHDYPETKRVHFLPRTKGEPADYTPDSMPTAELTSRRLIMHPRLQTNVPFGQRPTGPLPHLYGYNTVAYRSPPVQLHHPLHPPHAPYHHLQQPWFHSPTMAASMAGRMAYPPQRLMQPTLSHAASNEWICDFCNVASFTTYEEAWVHEEACKIQCSNRISHGYGTYGKASPRHQPPALQATSSLMSRSGSAEEEPTPSNTTSTSAVMPANSDTWHSGCMSLTMGAADSEWLSELNCFIRSHCIEVFSATEEDVSRSSKRGRIALEQVGIRCCYCADIPSKDKAVAAVSFPTSIGGIYESVKRWQRVHLEVCGSVPPEARKTIDTLANANVWVPTTRQYWSDSAKALGLVDTTEGIRFGLDPKEAVAGRRTFDGTIKPSPIQSRGAEPADEPVFTRHPQGQGTLPMDCDTTMGGSTAPIVYPEDKDLIPPYVFFLMHQVERCSFTESDRFVARSKGPVGYPGFQCRHCKGHAGLGKYFPVSAKSLSTNSTSQNIHAHLLKCRKCPENVKECLLQLKIEKGKTPRLEPGWRKIFFDMVWGRLHG